MYILDNVGALVDVVTPWLFPLGVVFFFVVYPCGLLISVLLDGRAANRARDIAEAQHDQKFNSAYTSLKPPSKASLSRRPNQTGCCFLVKVAIVIAVCTSLGFVGSAVSFVLGPASVGEIATSVDAGVMDVASQTSLATESFERTQMPPGSLNGSSAVGMTTCAAFAGLLVALRYTRVSQLIHGISQPPKRSKQMRGNKVFRRGSGYDIACPQDAIDAINTIAFRPGVPVFKAPAATPLGSLWHNVDLRVKNWFDQEIGLYRYVNEIPFGGLQKFEMHTKQPENSITEHHRGSKKLQAFGVPVPFNYGCFPQTFRDPCKTDEISGVGGDDDPLDVIDLTEGCVDPGTVVCCRPLGAVCLIDEGQADWKILVVNLDVSSPLSAAYSVADVERIAPGKIAQVLKWMDDFKQHSTVGSRLNFQVHDAQCAMNIIERDHASYRDLIAKVGPTGYARGHWIGSSPPEAEVSTIGWPLEHNFASSPAMMGTTRANIDMLENVPHRMLTMRRQASPLHSSSDESDVSSMASNGTSDQEYA